MEAGPKPSLGRIVLVDGPGPYDPQRVGVVVKVLGKLVPEGPYIVDVDLFATALAPGEVITSIGYCEDPAKLVNCAYRRTWRFPPRV